MKTGWVIKVYQDRFQRLVKSYYTGCIYTSQGDLYGAFADIEEAKVYTSQKRAINAMEKLKPKIWNWEVMEVASLEDETWR